MNTKWMLAVAAAAKDEKYSSIEPSYEQSIFLGHNFRPAKVGAVT